MSRDNIHRSRHGRLTVRARIGACIIAAALSGAACSPSAGGPVVYATYDASSPFGEGDGALLAGTLREQQGCIVVETEDGTGVLPISPAASTTWDQTEHTLTISEATYPLDSRVSFGGGYADPLETMTIPTACDTAEESFIVTSAGVVIN